MREESKEKKKKEPRELKYWLTVSGHLPFLMKIS
ncbi:hypothetical protein C824_000122 [Schaedlerella arabinosiphila]|nr:hypothetical protein C824_000122 [Schaedlerella arabinosiphila]